MATETTSVLLGHLLASSVLEDRRRRLNPLGEAHCLLFGNRWLDNFEEKSLTHRGK